MRKLSHRATQALSALALALPAFATSVCAQTAADALPIIIPSQSSIYNQNAVSLPSPPIANGQDVVRGVSGASCQSAVAGGGPYLDLGVIGSQDVFNRDTAAVYGRIVVPIGARPKRIDCTEMYQLEIARMRMELDLLRMGAPLPTPPEALSSTAPLPGTHAPSPVRPVQAPASPLHERIRLVSVGPGGQ